MISRLTGKLIEKNPPQIVIDVNGVGYEADVSMQTFYNLPALGEADVPFVIRFGQQVDEDTVSILHIAVVESRNTDVDERQRLILRL